MDHQSQNRVDMSLDEIIKLNRKEKRQAKKTKVTQGRGRGLGRGRGRGQLRGIGGGTQAKLTGRGLGQRGAPRGASRGAPRGASRRSFAGRGRGKDKLNAPSFDQTTSRSSMRGVNLATIPRRGRGRGRGAAQQKQMGISPINRQTSLQNVKNLRGIGRGRGNRGGSMNIRKQRIFTNSVKRQPVQRQQQLAKVKTQATLLREKEAALKNLQQAKRNMQSINKAIQQTSRDTTVNQRRDINTNGTQIGRGRKKLLAGLMTKNLSSSMPNLSPVSDRQMLNTSVTIANPRAENRKRQWRTNKSNVVLHVENRPSFNPGTKPSFVDQLKNLKPTQSTTYKFQKNMFAVPSTSLSLNDRFSSQTSAETSPDDRKVFV